MVPSHHGGHRRNGSEFIGGDGRNAVTGLMSTSPTKGEECLPLPPGARTGPPAGRRGHAHRRSGAMSSHDVSAILKPPTEIRGGSAPTTPSDNPIQPSIPPFLDRSTSQPNTVPTFKQSPPGSHHRRASSTAGQTRPRVGFSDHVEFIPRPLSTISSETSSSFSTIRPSHSVTGSISSIVSNGNASPSSAKSARFPVVDNLVENEGAAFALPTVQGGQGTPVTGRSNVQTGLGNPSDVLLWSEVFKSSRGKQETNHSDPSNGASSILRPSEVPDALRSRRRPVSSLHPPITRPRSSPEPKVFKRQRKVKSWAGSFLARKARNSLHEDLANDRGPPTELQSSSVAPHGLSFEHLNFDEDTTCVIDTAPPQNAKRSPVKIESLSTKARQSSPDPDTDESSQILDLDALCVPAAPGPCFEEVTGSRSAGVRRRLHSSGATGGFNGPGMHYHRRAESAPELAPINRRIFGSPGLASSTAMADVFEEDEEDEAANQEKDARASAPEPMSEDKDKDKDEQAHGLGVSIVDVAQYTENPAERQEHPVAGPFSKNESSNPTAGSATSVASTAISDGSGGVEIVRADEEPRESAAMKSSTESAVTPTLANDPFIARPVSAPMQRTFPAHVPAFATPETYSSAMSTPDFSQTSFEGPRLHTAASSITDRGTLSSFRTGDQGFDLRVSVDDVPSLTSSASTMASGYPPGVSSSALTRSSAERPSSLTPVIAPRTQPGNASKRSSLASLSRLVGGSYGEKSKLSIEERAQSEDVEKTEKKKGRRISRLMRFWKSKEKTSS